MDHTHQGGSGLEPLKTPKSRGGAVYPPQMDSRGQGHCGQQYDPTVSGSKGRIRLLWMSTFTNPVSLPHQSIHSPERGSFSRLPENMARINRGQAQSQAQRQKMEEASEAYNQREWFTR